MNGASIDAGVRLFIVNFFCVRRRPTSNDLLSEPSSMVVDGNFNQSFSFFPIQTTVGFFVDLDNRRLRDKSETCHCFTALRPDGAR
jgi:hypothetical protein